MMIIIIVIIIIIIIIIRRRIAWLICVQNLRTLAFIAPPLPRENIKYNC